MTTEEFQKLVLEKLVSLEQNTATKDELLDVKQSITRIEHDHGEKLQALFDAREVQFDVNDRICDTLNRIEGKMDKLTIKMSAHDALLKRAK